MSSYIPIPKFANQKEEVAYWVKRENAEAAAKTASSAAPALRSDATPEERADHEWEHDPQARKDFKSKAELLRYHQHVAKGRIKPKV
ncbi:MAG: hypothetical protein K8S99_06900 [Planctomycetes bacterium]|nr:hypothetical protein [Planctomycetota bacterium]